jgi:hypothetical protein
VQYLNNFEDPFFTPSLWTRDVSKMRALFNGIAPRMQAFEDGCFCLL